MTRPAIAAVRGAGLFFGVSLARGGVPDAALVRRVINGLRQRGILIGAAGRHGDVLKIRPPLPFQPEHVDLLVDALAEVLDD